MNRRAFFGAVPALAVAPVVPAVEPRGFMIPASAIGPVERLACVGLITGKEAAELLGIARALERR